MLDNDQGNPGIPDRLYQPQGLVHFGVCQTAHHLVEEKHFGFCELKGPGNAPMAHLVGFEADDVRAGEKYLPPVLIFCSELCDVK